MNDLHEMVEGLVDPFEGFKNGHPEAFRCYFHQHHYRIYCFLLRLTKDRRWAKVLTRDCFITLFRNYQLIRDAGQLLRVLYVLGRIGLTRDLQDEDVVDDTEIMEDVDEARNETLIALQQALQRLSGAKRELTELYFFRVCLLN